jgi:5-formyltetrahydrofolate cyclo-ligase
MPSDTIARLSPAVCARATALPAYAGASHVVGYHPLPGEIDPDDVLRTARDVGKTVLRVPRDPRQAPHLESDGGSGTAGFADGQGVLFLVPGIAFDAMGRRLGRGGGWYDRLLSHYPKAFRVGLACELQVVAGVPADPRDVSMHAVLTEARTLMPPGNTAEETRS